MKNFYLNNFFKRNNFKRTRKYDDYIINGYFANNLQIVFVRKIKKDNFILDEIIFLGVDLFKESLIIGFILKNDLIKDGVIFSKSSALPLLNISKESLSDVLKKFGIKNLKME